MDLSQLKNALEYIEKHTDEPLSVTQVAARAHASVYHFQRMFGILCGVTYGEYVRSRRLTRAALDLQKGEKVLDVALKYGYGTSESFSRAFMKFHGVKPAQVKQGAPVRIFAPISLNTEGETMLGKIEALPARTLIGIKRHFVGIPFGEERAAQEHEFYESTRGKQWLLFGAGGGKEEEYAVITNVTSDGYDYYIAYELDGWTQRALSDPTVLGMEGDFGFETLELPSRRASVFETKKSVHPVADYIALRTAIVRLMQSGEFELADAPELVVYHWHLSQKEERYIEICLPIA